MEKEYSEDDIRTLDWTEAVWLRPQLYFHKCFDENNLNNLALEVLCPAIDEYIDNNCSEINLRINDNCFQVEYNAGMELRESYGETIAEIFMTKLMACKNKKKHLEIGDEFCILGLATINAVAEKCELLTISDKKQGFLTFERGRTVYKDISATDINEESTKISFEMSKEIFGNLKFEFNDLQIKLNTLKDRFQNLKIELNKL